MKEAERRLVGDESKPWRLQYHDKCRSWACPDAGQIRNQKRSAFNKRHSSVVTDVTPKSGVVSARCARLSIDSGRELVVHPCV